MKPRALRANPGLPAVWAVVFHTTLRRWVIAHRSKGGVLALYGSRREALVFRDELRPHVPGVRVIRYAAVTALREYLRGKRGMR